MKSPKSPRSRPAAIVINTALLLAAAITLCPLLWMASVSLMAPGEAASVPPLLVLST